MRFKSLPALVVMLLVVLHAHAQAEGGGAESDSERREVYLRELLSLLPEVWSGRGGVSPLDSTWRGWLDRTGELPPNFAMMPSIPLLPDPLVLRDGDDEIPITTPQQWRQKKEQIKKDVKHWITGTFPPAPENLVASVLSERKDGEVVSRMVELRFGPERRAKLTLELLIPPGEGPFPVFITQWNHRGWALIAVRRGYIGCVYAGADARDDTEEYGEIWYPEYDFSRLMRRAWGAHRAVDYLHTLPIVDKSSIAITGHSRNGKQSLMAAAFDERITAVVSSSGGTGAENPWRYTSAKYDNNPINEITTKNPTWFHPRLRFFIGREHKLPVDQNSLISLIAPRAVMLSSAFPEHQGNPWGVEQNYHSLLPVYRFLGGAHNLSIRLRNGLHGTAARDIEDYVDFFDRAFGRTKIEPPRTLYYDYTFEKWRRLSGEQIDPLAYPEKGLEDLLVDPAGERIRSREEWKKKKVDILERVRWALGEEPPGATNPGPREFERRLDDDYLGDVIGRPQPTRRMGRTVIRPYNSFGDYLYGNLYYPADASGNVEGSNLPIVIYLHEYAYTTGFAWHIQPFFESIVEQGYAVFAFDMVGFGTRVEEGRLFYERYPNWSKMGRIVADVRAAVDMLAGLDVIHGKRIYVVGYALGGTVGLYSAALDERIAGVASVAGFTPMRLASADKGLEGIRAYSHLHGHLHGLLPRLGFFADHESRIPYDFHEIMAAIAPRPLMVVAPQLDRDADLADVEAAVNAAARVYSLPDADTSFTFSTPLDFNRFSPEVQPTSELTDRQREVVEWLSALNEAAQSVRE